MTMFKSVLIANRGEIACRIMRTAHALGYRTVAVFSPVDAGAPHVALADEAVALAGDEPARSYLDVEQLIAAARVSGAEAVHPGYGFLAENERFAAACIEAGLTWIGPPPEAIAAMGNKRRAKAMMSEAGVPVIPGARGSGQEADALASAAGELGLPVMVKAAAGGGGKGMRRVEVESELAEAIRAAASEARSSFGSGELIIEKALVDARHVEVQVFADGRGNTIHLGERDCSMQRRHQKIVEECPSPAVDEALRERMGEAAVAAARAIGYVGAGTVEFLLDADGAFYFLEMNTRLQVEHPVTERVTGFDLVAWQLRIAAGERLPVSQDAVRFSGCAIEARLYAEAPERGFLPQAGTLSAWRPPHGEGVRVDAGVGEGQAVTPRYDPLLAKIIASGPDRETARRRLVRALENTVAQGLRTNRSYLVRALSHPAFVAGEVTTGFIDEHEQALARVADDTVLRALSAALLAGAGDARLEPHAHMARRLKLQIDAGPGETAVDARAERDREGIRVAIADKTVTFEAIERLRERVEYGIEGRRLRARCHSHGPVLWPSDTACDLEVHDRSLAAPKTESAVGEGKLAAPMDGTVVALEAAAGDQVTRGQAVAVIEAMKMETVLKSDIDGVVESLTTAAGESVRKGQLLAVVVAQEPDDARG